MKKFILTSFLGVFLFVSCDKKAGDSKDGTNPDGSTKNEIVKPVPPKSEGPIRVLFVGNSHTEYFASYPELLKALSKENGKNVEVETLLTMGVSIDQILAANKSKADKMFAETDADGNYFDYIILQEATPVAIQEGDKFISNSKTVHDLAIKNSPDVATYVYQLMSPFEYGSSDFKDYQAYIFENVDNVVKAVPNSGVLNFANVLAAAYDGKENYEAKKDGKDQLRHDDTSKHVLNDGAFLNSIVLYQYLFGESPKIPQQLPLSTGTGDQDEIAVMDVNKGVSNPEALRKIANSFK